MPLNLNNLNDAEQFQKHFVTPMIDAVKTEIAPLVQQGADHEKRLKGLESNQKKALVGYSVVAVLIGSAVGYVKAWIVSKLTRH